MTPQFHLPVLLVKLIDIILLGELLQLCQVTHRGSFVNLPEVLVLQLISSRQHTPVIRGAGRVLLFLSKVEYLLHCIWQLSIALAPSLPDSRLVLEDHSRRLFHPYK